MNTSFLVRMSSAVLTIMVGSLSLLAPIQTQALSPAVYPNTGSLNPMGWQKTGPIEASYTYGHVVFNLRETQGNPDAHLVQDATIGSIGCVYTSTMSDMCALPENNGFYTAITYAQAAMPHMQDITGNPHAFVYLMNGDNIIQTITLEKEGGDMWTAGKWEVLSASFTVPLNVNKVRMVLEQAEHAGTFKDGRAAIFEQPGLFREIGTPAVFSYKTHLNTDRIPYPVYTPPTQPTNNQNATCDKYWKKANSSTVYLICSDNTRHAFLNAQTFLSWANWSDIRTVPSSQMNTYTLKFAKAPMRGKAMMFSDGVYYKQTNPQGYVLRPVSSQEISANPAIVRQAMVLPANQKWLYAFFQDSAQASYMDMCTVPASSSRIVKRETFELSSDWSSVVNFGSLLREWWGSSPRYTDSPSAISGVIEQGAVAHGGSGFIRLQGSTNVMPDGSTADGVDMFDESIGVNIPTGAIGTGAPYGVGVWVKNQGTQPVEVMLAKESYVQNATNGTVSYGYTKTLQPNTWNCVYLRGVQLPNPALGVSQDRVSLYFGKLRPGSSLLVDDVMVVR